MPRFRPRISLLSALLLMTIAGLSIVVAQLWREVGPLRKEVIALRNEVGRLSIDDRSQIHAIQLRSDEDLTWKWRIWIPEGKIVTVHLHAGDVPRTGVPMPRNTTQLASGEQTLVLKMRRDRSGKHWLANLDSSVGGGAVGTGIPPNQEWFNWGQSAGTGDGVGLSTFAFDPRQKTMILARHRVAQVSSSTEVEKMNGPTAGFIIWMDQQ